MIPHLTHWESFYVIVGSSAAALTGLQFVVITLIADLSHRVPTSTRTVAAFGTPTVVHFCTVLLIASILTAPWSSLYGPMSCLVALACAGLVYGAIVLRRARGQDQYKPELEDWIWHTILPFVAHVTLLIAGLSLQRRPTEALFVIGAISLLLLFIGIHNAWDTVTYIAITRAPQHPGPKRESRSR